MSEMKMAGTPTAFKKSLTASLRRPAATASPIRLQSSETGGRLLSTMKGASYNASFLMPGSRFAASSASTAPEEMPETNASPPASRRMASRSSISRSTA